MYLNPEDRIKEIEKELVRVGIIDAPGAMMLGLGMYGKFGANGDAFHPFLNDPMNTNILVAVGAAIMAWGAYKYITLGREKTSLKKQHGI